MKEKILEAVIAQIESEILTDKVDIDLLLEDPSIFEHKENVPYTVHEKLHHLAVHEKALEIAWTLKNR